MKNKLMLFYFGFSFEVDLHVFVHFTLVLNW